MPKTSKTKPKNYTKSQPKKNKFKNQPKPVSITTKKSYWITLTAIIVVALLGYGFLMNIAMQKLALIMVTVLTVIGFACYIRIKPSTLTNKARATYIFVGAVFIGFSIWAAMLLLSNATGLGGQVSNSLGDQFFITASQIIFLVVGAFIGELIGKNRNAFGSFFNKFRRD